MMTGAAGKHVIPISCCDCSPPGGIRSLLVLQDDGGKQLSLQACTIFQIIQVHEQHHSSARRAELKLRFYGLKMSQVLQQRLQDSKDSARRTSSARSASTLDDTGRQEACSSSMQLDNEKGPLPHLEFGQGCGYDRVLWIYARISEGRYAPSLQPSLEPRASRSISRRRFWCTSLLGCSWHAASVQERT